MKRLPHMLPDVILMDIVIPGCDGLAATRVIKAQPPNIKVVMLTMSETDEGPVLRD